MALKIYELRGLTFQFDDQDVPAGAVEVRAVDVIQGEIVPEVKAVKPDNKAVTPENKAVSDGKPVTRTKR